VNEKRVQVGTHYYKRLQRYVYDLTLHHFDKTQVIWKRSADWVDDAITHHFLEKLKETFNAEAWNETVQESHEILERELRRKRAERQSLEADMQSVILIMETVSNASIIRKEEARYEEMERELERLTADIAALEKGYSQFAAFSAMRTSLFNVPMGWAKLSRDERHNFIAIFTDSIEVTEHKADDALRLVIHWRDNSTDVITIGRKPTTGRAWTAVDRNKLRELAQVKASQIEIAAAFPDLKWGHIRNAITRHVGRYTYPVTYVHKDETYNQFLARGGTTARPIRSFRDTSLEVCYQ
jgi:hypothetical protein